MLKLSYEEAMWLYSHIYRLPENKVLLDLIAEAIMKEKNVQAKMDFKSQK
jgi:hypothetical protein